MSGILLGVEEVKMNKSWSLSLRNSLSLLEDTEIKDKLLVRPIS